MPKVTPPLKYPGGQSYAAKLIVSRMPARCRTPNAPDPGDPGWLHYVEPYFGGGSVLFANDPEGISEAVNDKHARLTNFWRVLQEPDAFALFRRKLEATPMSQPEFDRAGHAILLYHLDVDDAVRYFTRMRQSFGGTGKSFSPASKLRTRGGMNEQASAWLGSVRRLDAVHARMRRVLVLGPANGIEIIRQQDSPRTFFYCDPTFLGETRETKDLYDHEMSVADHQELLETLSLCKGKFALSGYPSPMYTLAEVKYNWNRHDFTMPNNASGGKKKRTRLNCLWTNY